MTELLPFLKSLLSVSGLSGHEAPAARLIEAEWHPLVDEIHFSRIGSLHALKKGNGPGPRPSLLVAAHMDAIGLIVKKVVDGFLYTASVGGVDVRTLPGTPMLVHTEGGDLPAVAAMPMGKLLPAGANDGFLTLEHLVVDTGLTPSDVKRRVRVGDLVSFDTPPVEMAGETLSGHSLDNRASVAALTVALRELQSKSHAWDVWAVASVQEEVGAKGAATSAFQLRPNLAIAVDVTFAKGPGANGWESFPLGKGITLGLGPNIHPFLHTRFKELADRLEIPNAIEPMPRSSGTDGMTLQMTAEGIPNMVLGIPLRYMHTPVEVVALKDIQRAGRLLAEFIGALEADFIESIVWE
jgi:endoglucanase